jgi:RNA polymerase sigma-70 factor (ECF subfamily)
LPAPQYAQMSPRPDDADDADDAALLRRVAGGDRDALGALYRRHAHVVLAQIRLAVGEPGLSEEILQDTMLAVWRGAGSFRGVSQVRSWIIAIALRQARDRLRRRRVAVVADESVLSGQAAVDPGPEEQVLERAELAVVAEAIRSLRPGHREVLGLVFGADLTLADAAEVLGVPVGTVKSRLAAARTALARALGGKGVGR